jgi:hypothetical protein
MAVPKATAEITVRIADYEPVMTVLAAAGDFAKAVKGCLSLPSIQNAPRVAESLERALREFEATVLAQGDA